MSTLERAIIIATTAHTGQRDKAGAPYILPLGHEVTPEIIEAACPVANVPIYACDFHVEGIETLGNPVAGGYRAGRICNIDHHAPTEEMARQVTSTMLALDAIRAGTIPDGVAFTVINHTDCDSVLSSALVMGLVPDTSRIFPDVHAACAEASIAADHTGAAHPIADLLQGLDEIRNGDRTEAQYLESLRNLLLLLDGQPLEQVAEAALRTRDARRAEAAELVRSGRVRQTGPIAFGELTEDMDGAFFAPLLPDAWVIMLVSPHTEYPEKWGVKLRLGASAPSGFTLHTLGIDEFDSAFGGRWNAGSNKRGAGTTLAPEEYLRALAERVGCW